MDSSSRATGSETRSTSNLESTTLIPSPPDGKTYHVFFSYCTRDSKWVVDTVNYLEEEYGLKCSFHERDFHPGKSIVRNINDHIEMSVKTVIVLSSSFLESEWCNYETEVLMHLRNDRRQNLLIPVLLQTCDVPPLLRPLTYLDARAGDMTWTERLVTAITSRDVSLSSPLPVSLSAYFFSPHYYNMDKLCALKPGSTEDGDGFHVTYLPEGLRNRGVSIPHDEYVAAAKLVDKALEVSIKSIVLDAVFAHLDLPQMFLLPLLGWMFLLQYVPFLESLAATVFKIILYSLYPLSIVFTHPRRKKWQLTMAVQDANKILIQYNIIAGVTHAYEWLRYHNTKLHLFYFDASCCKNCAIALLKSINNGNRFRYSFTSSGEITLPKYIVHSRDLFLQLNLKEKGNAQKATGVQGSSRNRKKRSKKREQAIPSRQTDPMKEAEFESRAWHLLMTHSQFYVTKYLSGSLERGGHSRHNRHVPCLCQYVEHQMEAAEKRKLTYLELSDCLIPVKDEIASGNFRRAIRLLRLGLQTLTMNTVNEETLNIMWGPPDYGEENMTSTFVE